MILKVEDIQKYDKIVRTKYPTAVMRKVNSICLTWSEGYVTVATLKLVKEKFVLKFEE